MTSARLPKIYSVPAVERALDIIEAMASASHEMTITEANRKLKIPKSSVYAILQTLKSRGYVDKDDADRYFLTLKIFSLGSVLVDSLDLRKRLFVYLQDLTERAGITGHVAVLDSGYAVYIEKAEVLRAVRLTTWVGKRMPLHSTSIGKALLAYRSEAEIDANIAARGLHSFTERTITSARKLKAELARVRDMGYAISNEENEPGVRAVAAPIFDHEGKVVAAVNLGGPAVQMKIEDLPALGKLVRAAAAQMSRALGYRGTAPSQG